MNFKNGYLGAFLIVIAVVLTISGSYIMSLDVTDKEVTKYSEVAELTGLFDSEPAPAYINYNPSTNYTGYYTDPDTKYFDGVEVTTSSQPNQYTLKLAPLNTDSGTETLIGDSTITGGDKTYMRIDSTIAGTDYYWTCTLDSSTGGKAIDIATMISNLSVPSWATKVILKSTEDLELTATGAIDSDAVLFIPTSTWVHIGNILNPMPGGSSIPFYAANIYTQEYIAAHPEINNPTYPMLACEIDMTSQTATLYYDKEMTRQALANLNIDSITVMFGGSSSSQYTINLGSEADYIYDESAPRTYMDIRQGVKLEDVP